MAVTMDQIKARRQKAEQKAAAQSTGGVTMSQIQQRREMKAAQGEGSTPHQSPAVTASPQGEAFASTGAAAADGVDSDLYAAALEDYRAKNNLGFADELDSRSDRLNGSHGVVVKKAENVPLMTGSSPAAKLNAGQKWDTALQAVQQQAWEQKLADLPNLVREKQYTDDDLKQMGFTQAQIDLAKTPAQGLKASYDKYNQPDEFDKLNQWYDQPRHQELVSKMTGRTTATYAQRGTSMGGSIDPFREKEQTTPAATDAELRKMGYNAGEIQDARNYLEEMAKIPEWKKASRRTSNFVGGIIDSMAGGGMMTAETGVQGAQNIADTQKNWAKVRQEIAGDERAETLFDLLTDVDMDYNPTWPESRNRELVQMGYGSEEIRNMRQRLAGLEVNTGIDKDRSIGYQLYARGQNLSGAAQSGLTPTDRAVQGIVGSAAENLAISSINPAAVLPLLSLQGAADAMGQSIEEGDSAGKTFAEGVLKFGAGWGINSVGTADLARTMGSDYAKNTVAGKISELVRTIAGQAPYAEQYPAIANAVSGGIDNAAQAFIETYADKAVDAALGDPEAAQTLFSKKTLLDAMEAGLTGGASGALGGAVGTGLAKLNAGNASLLGNAEYYAAEAAREAGSPSQTAQSAASSPKGRALGMSGNSELTEQSPSGRKSEGSAAEGSGIINETQVNDDPAEHTAAQNASIAEYKNSVDPKMAEYVDKVRAGEKLEPYVVTKTSDRMRSAMMELTGLDKVGDYTLLDNNGVNHITNRHAGGDGSADATMKNSADVARAAYVLNNYDNAYLAKDRADGYMTSSGKRAPIVLFEKKIDGSHIVVEAVCDTKKNKNFIVSEYLSKNGVDEKEIAKRLQPSMDAVADPRDTSGTLSAAHLANAEVLRSPVNAVADPGDNARNVVADPSTGISIASTEDGVNGKSVENAGERVESANGAEPLSHASRDSSPSRGALGMSGNTELTEQSPTGRKSVGSATEGSSYADVENRVDEGQLEWENWNRLVQKKAARQLVSRAQMTTKAAQAVVDAMPEGVGAGVYAQAANSLYRLGIQEDVKSFEQAVSLTGGMNTLGGAVRQVLALGETGENALRIAYTYGQGEAEAYNARKAAEIGGGSVALNPDAGTYFKGRSVSKGENAFDAFIELGAKSSGSAIHRAVEGLQNNAKGFIKAAAGEMYLSGEAGSETVMHETFHMLNEWSPETGQAVMDRLLTYLVQQNGMESTEKLVQSYLDKYEAAGKKITWNQALEEITADAMETVFGTADSFRNFVRQQAAEAKMNAAARGMIGKVMDRIQSLLDSVLADVNRFLKKEPTNAAAKAAKSLTEEQLKDLQQLYFDHQIEAGSKYREALENKNRTTASTHSSGFQLPVEMQRHGSMDSVTDAERGVKADDVKYSLPDMASETEAEKTERQEALTIRPAQVNPERTARVSETDWSARKTQDVYKAIRTILNEFGVTAKTFRMEDVDVEFTYGNNNIRESANKQALLTQSEYNDFMLVQANIEEVLANAVPLEAHPDKKGKAHVDGMIVLASALQDGERIIPVRAELKLYDNRPTALYMAIAETTAEESRNAANEKRTGSLAYDDAISHTMEMPTGSSENPDRKVRQEPLLTQEAAFPGSSDLTITDFYSLVKHDANFTKYFSDEVAYKAERVEELKGDPARSDELEEVQERLAARARAMEKDRSYRKGLPEPFLTQDDSGKYQLDVDSDAAEATRATALGDAEKQTDLMRQVSELGGKVRLSDQSITGIARAVLSDTGSKLDAKTFTQRIRALSDYIALTKDVSWDDVFTFAQDIAEQLMLKSSKKNDELWRQYKDLHQMSMTIEKGSKDYQEILYHWGSWANARKELARHGVKLTQSKEGVHSRWDADFTELQKLGAGLLPTETPSSAVDALEAMAAAHDTIRPVMENAYDEDWDGAKQDIAMQIMQRYMNSPEVANDRNAEARKEFAKQWEEVRKQAKQEALEARAKAELALAEKRVKDGAWASRELAKRSLEERARRDAQIEKVRTAREMDNTRRYIRRLTTQLNGMITKDKAGSNVPTAIASQVLQVAKIANESIQNKKMLAEMGRLQQMIGLSAKDGEHDRVGMEWLNSGMDTAITDWLSDVNDSRELALARTEKEIQRVNKRLEQLVNAAEKTGQDYSKTIADLNAYASHLKQRQMEYENGGMARMTNDQLRGLRDILQETITIVKNENKILGEEYTEAMDTFADGMTKELREAKGTNFGNTLPGKLGRKLASYKLNTMNIQRMFERMGGYVHGGYMEKAGKMLNDGQYKKTRLIVEGTAIFDNVTGPGNLKKMDRFSHELIDIGLRSDAGKAIKITREQAVALYFQCQNLQGLHHMTHGGLKVMDMEYAVKGDTEMAKHYAETVRIGDLKFDDEGHMLDRTGANVADEAEQRLQLGQQRREFLAELEKALFTGDMADYCKLWIEDYKKFEQFTKKNINETSMILNGRAKATVENYIPLHVDEDTNLKKNEGIRYDNSVGSEGFLKQRVPSGKPIWLDGIGSVVNTSLENTAQYAGMAIPLRNIQKLMNTQLNGKTLYADVEQTWGKKGEQYLTQAISDLHPQKGPANLGDSSLAKLRSRAAAAVLTANLNVTFLQAASLPTAAAELGWKSTGAAAIQFGKNIDPVNKLLGAVGLSENKLKAIEQEISEHGDALLQYRLRGTQSGELGSLGEMRGLLGKAHDALLDSDNKLIRGGTQFADDLVGSITKMDEITVAALWEGAKSYVKNNPAEFNLSVASGDSSPGRGAKIVQDAAYWEAVNQQYQRVVERTQPNYTTMQRTGFQRDKDNLVKTLMMFSTQRQQNAQIWVSAAEDYMAQKRRDDVKSTEETRAAKAKAGKRLIWAITSQMVQTATIAAIGMGVKLLLHRRKDLQDENGDITWKSAGGAFGKAFLESLMGNFVGGSELYTAVAVIAGGTDYDTVSLTGLSTVNDTVAAISSLVKEIMMDTSELDADDLAKHDARVQKDILSLAGSVSQFYGIPFNNVKKYFEAAAAYAKDVQNGTLLDFSDLPESATGQYDRLFTAIESGDGSEGKGALKKLDAMGKNDKITGEVKKRLKKYDEDILDAAKAKNAGKSGFDAKQEVFDRLCTAYGVKQNGEKGETAEDKARRNEFIDLINKAVDEKAEELYKGGTGGSVYDALKDAVDSGRAKDVQAEIQRLRTAGREDDKIKNEITKAAKEEYLAGNDHDRAKLEQMLLQLEKADGEEMYAEKDFAKWVNDAEKKEEEAESTKDEWEALR